MIFTEKELRAKLRQAIDDFGLDINTLYPGDWKERLATKISTVLAEAVTPVIKDIRSDGNKVTVTYEMPCVLPVPELYKTPLKHFNEDDFQTCLDDCEFEKGIKIGSVWCTTECNSCKGCDREELWVKCQMYGAEQ